MKKQPARTEATKQSIIDSFWNLYQTKTIEKISIKEITDGADVYRSTFYLYFQDIYQVLEEIENRQLDQIQKSIAVHAKTVNPQDLLTQMIHYYLSKDSYLKVFFESGNIKFIQKYSKICSEQLRETFQLNDEPRTEFLISYASVAPLLIANFINQHPDYEETVLIKYADELITSKLLFELRGKEDK